MMGATAIGMDAGTDTATDGAAAGSAPTDMAPATRAQCEAALRAVEAAIPAAGAAPPIELLFQRAALLQQLGDETRSRSAYLETLARDPDHPGALCNLGREMMRTRHYAAARMLLLRAVEKHPDDRDSRVALGMLLVQTDDPAAARTAFAQVLERHPEDAIAHTGMAFALTRLGDPERAAEHRRRGFQNRSIIEQPYRGDGEAVRVLMLASANEANAPLERFLDEHTFQVWIAVTEFQDPRQALPDHDLVVNAAGDVDADAAAVRGAITLAARTDAPVINAPQAVARTGRCDNWHRLQGVDGVLTPHAQTLPRAVLEGGDAVAALARHGLSFPLLLRSPGYHGGDHFARVDRPDELPAIVAALPGAQLIAIEFLDLRDADGKNRKYRVMMVDGRLYPLHLAIGHRWKLHYRSADMADNAAHRAEDARFLADMAGVLGPRAMQALSDVQAALGLDYGGIDFAVAPDGRVVVFEANATMIVPPPDADPRWDYRRPAVARIDAAVRRMLLERAGRREPAAT